MPEEKCLELSAAIVGALKATLGYSCAYVLVLQTEGDLEVLTNAKPHSAVPRVLRQAAEMTAAPGETIRRM